MVGWYYVFQPTNGFAEREVKISVFAHFALRLRVHPAHQRPHRRSAIRRSSTSRCASPRGNRRQHCKCGAFSRAAQRISILSQAVTRREVQVAKLICWKSAYCPPRSRSGRTPHARSLFHRRNPAPAAVCAINPASRPARARQRPGVSVLQASSPPLTLPPVTRPLCAVMLAWSAPVQYVKFGGNTPLRRKTQH